MHGYKLKYYSLSKEEKNKLKEKFYNTSIGSNIDIRLKRVLLYGILAIIFSVYLFFSENIMAFKILAIGLFVMGVIFIVASFRVRITKLNDYLVKNKNILK